MPHDSPLATEEIFGPVLPVLRVADLDEAITIANSTKYGLAASVFTSSLGAIHAFTSRVQAGMIHVNHVRPARRTCPSAASRIPDRGVLSIGPTAREYTNAKAIYLRW